jgi:hypothetical protein
VADVQIGSSLCGDVARLALQVGEGRLPRAGMLVIALRASVLLDLALRGAIDVPDGGGGVALDASSFRRGTLYVDVTPTGCTAHDQLLGYVRRHPNRTMDDVLRRGRPHLLAVTHELVRDGHWTVRRRLAGLRWDDAEADRFTALLWRLRGVVDGVAEPVDEGEAALAAVADVLGLVRYRDVDEPVPPALLDGLGSVAWLGRDVVEYLRRARVRREMAATPWGGGDG